MGKPRTKRKNAHKRIARRVFGVITAEIRQAEAAQWTPEAIEQERQENEAERKRVHDEWSRAVSASRAVSERKQRIKEERQRLLQSIRQRLTSSDSAEDR